MKEYWIGFNSVPGMKSIYWQKILSYFPDLRTAWSSSEGEILKAGISGEWVPCFFNFKRNNEPKKLYEIVQRNKIDIITFVDKNYPESLKEIYSPPYVLYIKGELKNEDINAIAIVGSRKGTDYGKRATFEISSDLARSKITIVSGLALGLDTEAHKGAIAGSGRTIAVLANGLDTIYPTSNTNLTKKILENGCVISEQPIGMPALKQNFPARNRIISGLSLGVMVTEAGESSGTLHTASFAIEQNKQIYALPGPIYNPLSKGPNNLIKNGAKPVTSSLDILEDFGVSDDKLVTKPEGEDEKKIFEILKNDNLHIDEITQRAKAEPAEISKTLTMMEIRGKVRHLGGMVYGLK